MSGQPFDVARDYIDEAIEMSEIDLNHRSGEGLRADEFPLSSLLAGDAAPMRTIRVQARVKHGTSTSYTALGCRCDKCKAWRQQKARADRARAKAKRAARRSMERRAKQMVRWHGRMCRCPECIRWEVG